MCALGLCGGGGTTLVAIICHCKALEATRLRRMTARSRIREGSGTLNKKKQLRSHFGKGQTEGSTSPLESIVAADKMAGLGSPHSPHLYRGLRGRTLYTGRVG